MIDHISLHVGDLEKSKALYAKAFAPLQYSILSEFPEWKVVGIGKGKSDVWIVGDGAKQSTHLALTADSKEVVDAFYAAAIEAGGTDNGAPGYRKNYSPGYYAAFVHDFDGHNIEVVFHDPTVTA